MSVDERGIRRLGVLGGTFDPPHVGHLIAASEALHAFELDRVMFVPAGSPWQKSVHAPAEDRFMMTTLATTMHRHFSASRIEIDRKGPSYTIDTLEAMAGFYTGAHLFFIAGADAVAELATWHRVEDLAAVTEIIAVTRPGFSFDAMQAPSGWPVVHPMEIPGIDVSSTTIRQRVAKGEAIDFLVPAAVAAYIKDHGLYVGGDNLDA